MPRTWPEVFILLIGAITLVALGEWLSYWIAHQLSVGWYIVAGTGGVVLFQFGKAFIKEMRK